MLTAGGLAAFVVISRKERRWFNHPAPYVSACVALAMITPVIWWNARNGWASFAFQGSRGVPGGLHPAQFLTMALGEVAFLSPWIFAALVAGLASAFRRRGDDRRLFLLCLSLPPIVLFTLTPLWGGRGQPHWTMPGWFFAFPLLGAWVDEFGLSAGALRRWAVLSSGLLAAIAGVAVLDASTGWPWAVLLAPLRRSPARELWLARPDKRADLRPSARFHHLDQMVGRRKNRARLRAPDPRFRAFERSARLGLRWMKAQASSAGAGSSSRQRRTPRRLSRPQAPCLPGWDDPRSSPSADLGVLRSTLHSSRLTA